MSKFVCLLFCLSLPLFAQSAKDSAAVRAAAVEYADAWYLGDVVRMEHAVHPLMVRRIIGYSPDIRKNENVLGEMDAVRVAKAAAAGNGTRVPEGERIRTVTILAMLTNTASVKLEMSDRFEILQLGRWNGQWKIINILWEMKPQE